MSIRYQRDARHHNDSASNLGDLRSIQSEMAREQVEAIRAPRAELRMKDLRLGGRSQNSPTLSKNPSAHVLNVYSASTKPLPAVGLHRKKRSMPMRESASMERSEENEAGFTVPALGMSSFEERRMRRERRKSLEKRILQKAREEGVKDSI